MIPFYRRETNNKFLKRWSATKIDLFARVHQRQTIDIGHSKESEVWRVCMCSWRVEYGSGNEEGDRLREMTQRLDVFYTYFRRQMNLSSHIAMECLKDRLTTSFYRRQTGNVHITSNKCKYAISSAPLTPILVTGGYISRWDCRVIWEETTVKQHWVSVIDILLKVKIVNNRQVCISCLHGKTNKRGK